MSQVPVQTDAELLASYARTRDADAFAELCRRYGRLVLGVARRVTRNLHDAEDVVQSCFLELAQNATAIRGSVGGWLHKAAYSRSFDLVRSRRARQHREAARAGADTSAAQAAAAPQPQSAHELIEQRIDESLRLLPQDVRLLLIRHYLEGMSQQDLARELGLTQPTVSRRIARGIELLRSRLDASGAFAITSPLLMLSLGQLQSEVQLSRHLLAQLGKLALAGPPAHLPPPASPPAPPAEHLASWAHWATQPVALISVASALVALLVGVIAYPIVFGSRQQSQWALAASSSVTPPPVAGLASQEGAVQTGTSPTFHGGNHRTGLVRAAGVPKLHGLRWEFATGSRVVASPVVDGNVVYVGSENGAFYALRLSDGAQLWLHCTKGAIRSSAAIDGGRVYFTSSDGVTHCLDQRTGVMRWVFRDADVVMHFRDSSVPQHVWDQWTLSPDARLYDPWDSFYSSPAVADGRVFIGGYDGCIHALDARTGILLWRSATLMPVRSSPAVVNGRVYVGSYDGRVLCLDAKSGRTLWQYHCPGTTSNAVQSSIAVAGGLAYFGGRNGSVCCLDAATGAEQWQVSHDGTWIISTPVCDARRVYAGASNARFVQALDLQSGAELWRTSTQRNVVASPMLASGVLYVGDLDDRGRGLQGTFYAIDAASGHILWTFDTPAGIQSSAAVTDGSVIFGCDDGVIRALH